MPRGPPRHHGAHRQGRKAFFPRALCRRPDTCPGDRSELVGTQGRVAVSVLPAGVMGVGQNRCKERHRTDHEEHETGGRVAGCEAEQGQHGANCDEGKADPDVVVAPPRQLPRGRILRVGVGRRVVPGGGLHRVVRRILGSDTGVSVDPGSCRVVIGRVDPPWRLRNGATGLGGALTMIIRGHRAPLSGA